ncbi:hypothetical protein NDU88_000667 [Pleurodeles waltl]|uniref:Uncharacterized protein n=1 Tax=Pleurodeles waltl TaxID=8319 RepID=A0AAV7TGD8_PLEWA|nr:hypothetical protein NDU88_000667 [Pleurodeles waltl]
MTESRVNPLLGDHVALQHESKLWGMCGNKLEGECEGEAFVHAEAVPPNAELAATKHVQGAIAKKGTMQWVAEAQPPSEKGMIDGWEAAAVPPTTEQEQLEWEATAALTATQEQEREREGVTVPPTAQRLYLEQEAVAGPPEEQGGIWRQGATPASPARLAPPFLGVGCGSAGWWGTPRGASSVASQGGFSIVRKGEPLRWTLILGCGIGTG